MASEAIYDVFLSHATPDKPVVEEVARKLRRRKLKPFLDKWHLVPGEPWQEALEEALKQSRTFAVFLGPSGIRPWQNEEMRTALATRARDKNRRVIPVLLPGALMPQEDLPPFLARLTWVDFREGLDDPQALRLLVSGIKGLPPGVGPSPTPSPTPASRSVMIGVPHRNPFFTDRETLLSQLHQQLQAQKISALAQAAIYGLGGIGKTQTAIEYAHRFGKHYRFVLWVVAESEPRIRTDYLSIARELKLIEANADFETAVLMVRTWLSREVGWLLVFDNADDPALVRPYLPSDRTSGTILLTSRAKSFVKVGIREPSRVETLTPADAARFLTERTGSTDIQSAAELAEELGYLPLALEQAAAYIETVGGGFGDYLTRYRHQGVALFANGEPSTDYPKTVVTTWTMSFAAVREASPASADLLTAAAFLYPDSIPIEIFTRGSSKLGRRLAYRLKNSDKEPLIFWELLEPLERYSLVVRLPDNAFRLHRLTQEVIKNSLGEMAQRVWAERVVHALNTVYLLVKHPAAAQSMTHLALILRALGDLAEARKLEEKSQEIRRQHIEFEERQVRLLVADSKDNLSKKRPPRDLERDRARAANELDGQILEIRQHIMGEEHIDTLIARDRLAQRLRNLGNLGRASKLYEQNIAILERILGNEHRHTLKTKNNLAAVLFDLGNFADARILHEQTLKTRERLLGSGHPDTTISTWNLLLTVRQLKEPVAEAQLIDQLRWLLDCDEVSIPSADQRIVRYMLLDLRDRDEDPISLRDMTDLLNRY